ncbi:hypothetical protein [Flavobacterium sp.]|uniref:hypothetical protein n=1 Tax=Flavobacterium sp. TaxID=239 RepID=UPI003753CD9F
MKKILLVVLIGIFGVNACKAQKKIYQCYANDKNSKNMISTILDANYSVIAVYYKGQKVAINLTFVKEEMETNGAHPTSYSYYKEIIDGKVTGIYVFIHSGIWDYIQYTNKKSKKTTSYTMTDFSRENFESSKPCF